MALHTYIPQDRLRALARGQALPDRCSGAALFADISGFTALTETLRGRHGERRGIEELTCSVNGVYDTLIGEVERAGGSVIGFAGDAITCWFDAQDGEASLRATRCALAMQDTAAGFGGLSVKVAVGTGPARRFAIGHPDIQLIDVLAGATLARVATGEGLARPGEVLVDEATAALLQAPLGEPRLAATGERFFVVEPSVFSAELGAPAVPPAATDLLPDAELLRPWLLPFVFDRESAGQGLFVTDLRPATALFVRFTGLDYDQDERAAEELATLVSQAQRVMHRHGGVLLELTIGDKGSYLYGNFGAAQVHEDDPARALRAALALRQFFAGTPYAVQIGLSSGTLRVGGYGSATRQSFGAMGDDVNTAARLMGMAQAGEILISSRVRQAVAGGFVLEARSPMPMKGKAEPMPVFAVTAHQQQRAIRLQEPAYALPMVGREVEAALLSQLLSAALRGQGQLLGICAEAGMGKSRLVAEGIRLARRAGFIGYGGACQLDGIRTPYLVWQAIWTAFFDLDPALPPRRQTRAAELQLQELAPQHADAWPLLGAVLGQDWPDNDFTRTLQPKDRKALLETLLMRCLESAAREAAVDGMGLLLVLEDVHTADPLSLDLLALVARAAQTLPVVVLLSYRPGDGEDMPVSALQPLPHFQQIELQGLDTRQAEQVIRAKLANLFPERTGAVPPALIERITGRAQGNPFYVEELLNYLHDRGIDPRDTAALSALDLPASLHSLVLSRIDQLRLSQQLSLKVASIIGRVFRVADLHGYYPALGLADAVKAELQELDRLGFTPLESPEPELAYLFKHLVTLEVGYESIAYATRAQLHGLYARFLEAGDGQRLATLAPQLAHHYLRAEQHDKACIYLRLAGEQAAARYANDEARACFDRALQLQPSSATQERFELLLLREAIGDLQGQHDNRRADLAQADQLALQLADSHARRAEVAGRRAKLEIDVGDYAAAGRSAQAAIDALKVIDAPDGTAREENPPGGMTHARLLVDALLLQARAIFFAGQAPSARPQLQQALALARTHGYPRGEYNVLSQMGLLHWHAGDFDAADDWLGQAVRLIEKHGDARRQIDILNNLGVVAKARSRYAQALLHYEAAQAIARRIGDRSGEAMLFNNMGSVCLESADFHQAGVCTEQAARIFAEVNEPAQQGFALLNRAEAHREMGQYRLAHDLSGQALLLLQASGHRRGECIVRDNLGLVALALGQHDEALQSASAALSIAREIGSRALEAGILLHLGRVHTAAGRLVQAQPVLDAAAALAQELAAEQQLLQVQAALAEWALATCASAGELDGASSGAATLERLTAGLPLLLQPSADHSAALPMWLHLTAHRVLLACGDARALAVLVCARDELQARCQRIPDAAARRDFLNVAEHRALLQA